MKKHYQQLQFFKKQERIFGGSLLHGKRRTQRPLSSKEALHIVIRSSWAKGVNSFLAMRNQSFIDALIREKAKRYNVNLYRVAIVGNHIHLVIRFKDRKSYTNFIRTITGLIAEHIMKKKSFIQFLDDLGAKGSTSEDQGTGQRFWQFRPFTRIIAWGKDFKNCCDYVYKNALEAMGFFTHRPGSEKNRKLAIESATRGGLRDGHLAKPSSSA